MRREETKGKGGKCFEERGDERREERGEARGNMTIEEGRKGRGERRGKKEER